MTESGGTLRLRTVLQPRGPAGAVVLTDDQVAMLGGSKTPRVRVTVNGVSVTARIGRMGGENLLGFSKKVCADLGVEIGQGIDVTIALDAQPRTVALPRALVDALATDPVAKAAFDALTRSRQKEYARWIREAKQEQTALGRARKSLQMLREGRARH